MSSIYWGSIIWTCLTSLIIDSCTHWFNHTNSVLFQVAFPHCVSCFGRCYPGGAALIADAKTLFDGISRLLVTSSSRELPKPVRNSEAKSISENGDMPNKENGVVLSTEQAESTNTEEEPNNVPSKNEEKPGNVSSWCWRAYTFGKPVDIYSFILHFLMKY